MSKNGQRPVLPADHFCLLIHTLDFGAGFIRKNDFIAMAAWQRSSRALSLDKQPSGNTSPSSVFQLMHLLLLIPTRSSRGAHAVKPVLGSHASTVDWDGTKETKRWCAKDGRERHFG